MEKTTLTKKDFNLTKEYELFDVIYSISTKEEDNSLQAWTVVGHELNSSSDKRCFEYLLCSYPISIFIKYNEHLRLSELRNHFVSRDKTEVLDKKKKLLTIQFDERIYNLK